MIYCFNIYAPLGVTGKMRIRWQPEGWLALAPVASQDAGDVESLTVDFKGDTKVYLSVPFSQFTPYLTNPKNLAKPAWNGTNCNGFLVCSLVSKIQNPFGKIVPVEVLVTQALAKDFRFFGLRDEQNITYQSAVNLLESPAPSIMPSVAAIDDGLCSLQEFKSFKDVWMLPRQGGALTTYQLDPLIGHPHESRTFHGFRGSRIIYSLMGGSTPILKLVLRTTGPTDQTLHSSPVMNYLQGHTLGWSLPMTSNVPWLPFNMESLFAGGDYGYIRMVADVNQLSSAFQYLATADDAQWFIPAFVPRLAMPSNYT